MEDVGTRVECVWELSIILANFSFGSTGDWIKSLALAEQALYHLSLLLLVCFSLAFAQVSLRPWSFYLYLLSTWDYRHMPPCLDCPFFISIFSKGAMYQPKNVQSPFSIWGGTGSRVFPGILKSKDAQVPCIKWPSVCRESMHNLSCTLFFGWLKHLV
jgi:hypothetical protein